MLSGESLFALIALLLVCGAAAGLIAGLLGVGGGIILVPAMVFVLDFQGVADRVSMHMAVATSLAVIVTTAMSSARAHWRRGGIDKAIARRWIPAMACGALGGALLARLISGDLLRIAFALLAIIIGLKFLRGQRPQPTRHRPVPGPAQQLGIASGIGALSAWLGIGGGSLSVPVLQALGLSVHRAVGTSSLLGLAIAIPATLGFIAAGYSIADRPPGSLGYVYAPAAATLAVTAALLAPVGARLAHSLDQIRLKQVFGIFLLMAGLRVARKGMS